MIVPFIGRLSFADYWVILLVYLETLVASILALIPQPIFNFFSSIINYSVDIDESTIEEKLRECPTIHEMCALFNIYVEDHLVRTEDNYILTIHRIKPIPGTENGKVVYLHHGLLMCSDVWCCQTDRNKNLPFVLHDLGYEVWMGNNRGNKYSTAHLYHAPKSKKFWDFSIDEFAFFDIPNSIEFILDFCKVEKLICIGFSQGSAQMFASFSLNEKLNSKVSHFIAIAPAMTPKRLHNRIADTFAKSSPTLMYLFFGRNIILPSATTWQRTIHPKIFNKLIDIGNRILFNWKSSNITKEQKIACYAKLYSTTSVKSIVHWFQILRSQKFSMFEESDDMFNSLTRPYLVPTFPTRTNIKIPILLIYGGNDLLVDIKVMKRNLPATSVFDVKVDNHEHLDLIWGQYTDVLVISKVLKFIEFFDNIGANLLPSISRRDSSASEFGTTTTRRRQTLTNTGRLLNAIPSNKMRTMDNLSEPLTTRVLSTPGSQTKISPFSQRRGSVMGLMDNDPLRSNIHNLSPHDENDVIAPNEKIPDSESRISVEDTVAPDEQQLEIVDGPISNNNNDEENYDDAIANEDEDDLAVDEDDEDESHNNSFLDEDTIHQNRVQQRRLSRYLSNEP
ncbi:similar to Saccharomyces cerevisiae YKL140W TGL1 Steryl ester hydrolase [Maudiozyma saulgeensis]|uniref:Similar to Saccharomyces cerevisiae YKL140W TGL1 Steryl ester hydrolase n=1 Tax=Maudiozyma saulgeensis TaxID=1789683 RepID=A0A1X7QZM7_9SACH|nr:similar to Saccharomyces cerevisiae YKL140W TGL1 Steryl ester hydrolase [Kazachstania saulgeensis]